MLPIDAAVNPEELLYLACMVLGHEKDDDVAVGVLVWYTMNEFAQKGIEPTEDQISDRSNEILAEFYLNRLVHKGLLEQDLEDGNYRLTEKGQAVAQVLV